MLSVLVDLSILRHPYCGLGQVALNYGRWYAAHACDYADRAAVTLLVPKAFVGAFGEEVRYLVAQDVYRWLPWLMPRYDVWHSIHQLSPFRPSGRTVRRILTIHDVNFMYEKAPQKRQRYLRRLQHEVDAAAHIAFISRFAQSDAARYLDFGSKSQSVIYNGVENLTVGEQSPVDVPMGTRRFFLAMGVVKAKKNLHVLLPLMRRMPDYMLLIAGNDCDPYAEKLRREMPDNVVLLGTVTDSQRRWLYAHCAALLFPSLCEGFGLPLVEAMQWGKPVFASTATSIPEIGGDHAFYFNDFHPDAMERVVRQGLQAFDDDRASRAADYARSFSYHRNLSLYWDIFLQ